MAKRLTKKPQAKQSKASEKQLQLLDQLKEIAAALDVEVREERLLREVGYNVRSGPCRVEGREVLLLDSNASVSERIDVLVELLSSKNLDSMYIEPRIRRLLGSSSPEAGRDRAEAI